MEKLKELVKSGIKISNSIKPVELTEDNSFIYDFENIEDFYSWRTSVLESINDEEAKELLISAHRGVRLPVVIGRVVAILNRLSGNINTTVSPLAPRSTDIE